MENIAKPVASKNNRSKLFILSAIVFLVLISWFDIFDRLSVTYVDGALVQGTVTFGMARAFNAAVSVLQSVQVGILGSSVTIGELLDPINDLVEQFSTLMKYAVGSLIIQKLLLEIVSETFFKILISISGVIFFMTTWMHDKRYLNMAMKSFICVLFLRYIVVLAITMNAVVDNAFIKEKFEENIRVLKRYQIDIVSISDLPEIAGEIETALYNELTALQNKQVQEKNRLEDVSKKVSVIEMQINDIEKKVSAHKGEQKLVHRLNPFEKDEGGQALDSALISKKSQRETLLSEQDRIREYLADIEKSIMTIENKLSGNDKGLFDSLRSITSGVTIKIKAFKAKISELVDRMGDAVPIILNMMALFTFRVMILPLVFLYLFLKGFKIIWNIDLRCLFQGTTPEAINMDPAC